MRPGPRCRHLLAFAVALCGCATTVPCGPTPNRCWVPPSLRCTITTPAVVRVGDRLPVRFMLRYGSTDWGTLHLLGRQTPLEGYRIKHFDVRRDGQPVGFRWTGSGHEPLDCRERDCRFPESDYVELSRGESVSVLLDLSEAYIIDRPGIYQIGFDGYFDHVDDGPTPPFDTNPSLARRRRPRNAWVYCREAAVTVLPREANP